MDPGRYCLDAPRCLDLLRLYWERNAAGVDDAKGAIIVTRIGFRKASGIRSGVYPRCHE